MKKLILVGVLLVILTTSVFAYGGCGGGIVLPPIFKKSIAAWFSNFARNYRAQETFVMYPHDQKVNGEKVFVSVISSKDKTLKLTLPAGKEWNAYESDKQKDWEEVTMKLVKHTKRYDYYTVKMTKKFLVVTYAK